MAQQVGLYQVQVFLRHQRITLEEGALPVDDGKTLPLMGMGAVRWRLDVHQNQRLAEMTKLDGIPAVVKVSGTGSVSGIATRPIFRQCNRRATA